jgi:hypothetical protein
MICLKKRSKTEVGIHARGGPADKVIENISRSDETMNRVSIASSLFSILIFAVMLLTGCGGSSSSNAPVSNPAPLNAGSVNLIFVVSPDLAYQASGDVSPSTANLTNQGLQRSLLMAPFLQQQVLGAQNVTNIYALEPMTHLQTAKNYPDLVGLESIEQFAMLNQISLSDGISVPVTAYSYPILTSYSSAAVPPGVAQPVFACAACQGIDFNDKNGDNEALLSGIVKANVPGFYVFSAPWETVSAMMANINQLEGYSLTLPASFRSPNYIYAIVAAPSGGANLVTYNSNLYPPSTYPVLPSPVPFTAECTGQTPFNIGVTGGTNGALIPPGINTNETVYMIRHAEAHPTSTWEDGNYIGAGQWRALTLPNALRGKMQPTQVMSIDPANAIPPGTDRAASSYIRTSLTVEPYAIANNLPHNLAASVAVFAQNAPQLSTAASDYLFTGGTFSNQTILMAWEHEHIPPTVNALLSSYQSSQIAPDWPDSDYDTIWTVKLDAQGNLTVDNSICEGIDSAVLLPAPPQF